VASDFVAVAVVAVAEAEAERRAEAAAAWMGGSGGAAIMTDESLAIVMVGVEKKMSLWMCLCVWIDVVLWASQSCSGGRCCVEGMRLFVCLSEICVVVVVVVVKRDGGDESESYSPSF
jgi:hypothetical protein